MKNFNISRTLYIRVSRSYIPEDKTEKKYYQSTKKGNLLLRIEVRNNQTLNKEVSHE
jgi:hypothetical protein